jgi:hypothetical protein
MEMVKREWLCRVGIHQYRAVELDDIDLIPMISDPSRSALAHPGTYPEWAILEEGVDLNTLQLETSARECRHCGKIEVKQALKW